MKVAAMLPFAWLGIGLAFAIFAFLPRHALLRVCDGASLVYFHLDRRGKRRALENLHILRGTCTGDEGTPSYDPDRAPFRPTRAEEILIRRAYRNMARTVGHIFWTQFRTRARVAEAGFVSEPIREFLHAEKPAITVSAHLGCWEILSQLACLEGHAMMSVAKRIGTGGMTALLMRARRSIGQEIVLAKGAFKPLLQGLRAGKSLGLLVDQSVRPKDGGIFVRFCGRVVPVSAAPAFFAAKARKSVVVAWSRPLKDGRYCCEQIATYTADEARDVWWLTQRIMTDLEGVIRRHPSCWTLNYRFFRRCPTERDLEILAKREGA